MYIHADFTYIYTHHMRLIARSVSHTRHIIYAYPPPGTARGSSAKPPSISCRRLEASGPLNPMKMRCIKFEKLLHFVTGSGSQWECNPPRRPACFPLDLRRLSIQSTYRSVRRTLHTVDFSYDTANIPLATRHPPI